MQGVKEKRNMFIFGRLKDHTNSVVLDSSQLLNKISWKSGGKGNTVLAAVKEQIRILAASVDM